MIVSRFNPRRGDCSVIIESSDDLWLLRRLIRKGDEIVTWTSRVVKRDEEFARPDKGERVKLTIALEVEEITLDRSIERLRIRGIIKEASDESVSRAGTHSVSVSPGHPLAIRKVSWNSLDIRLVNSAKHSAKRFVVVAIDRREAGVGVVSGSHLSIVADRQSGASEKMWEERSIRPFIKSVLDLVKGTWRDGDVLVIAGPGHTKLALASAISQDRKLSEHLRVVESYDLAGADGVRGLAKFPGFQKVAGDAVIVEMQNLLNECVRRISVGDAKVAYSFPRVRDAATAGAVEACIVSEDVFGLSVREQDIVDALNIIDRGGGRVLLADSSLEVGKQVSSLGGLVATLRYAFKPWR